MTDVAIAMLISIACINIFVFIMLKASCDDIKVFRARVLQWVALQSLLFASLLLGWLGWHLTLRLVSEESIDLRLRILLALIAIIPAGVVIICMRRWVGSIRQK
ncbi:MAG: hypothetical protein HZRFUVUK_002083 [Candidatus Fervidibacterota bacterium]